MPIIVAPGDNDFVTLDELKDHLNITKATQDAELYRTLRAASEVVESLVGPVLHRTVVETVTADYAGDALLRYWPVVSLTSVTYDGNPVDGAVSGGAGFIYGLRPGLAQVVTYVAGRTEVPDLLVLATLIIAGHLWETQRGAAPTPLPGEDFTVQPGLGYAIPNRTMELLAPYLLPSSVA